MKKINIILILVACFLSITISSCKKPSNNPSPQELIKRNWKASKVDITSGGATTNIYDASKSSNIDDYSKFQIKFDGTNYNYTDVNGNASSGTYTFGTDNSSIIFKGGALDGKIYTITTLNGGSFVFLIVVNNSPKPSYTLTVSAVPV